MLACLPIASTAGESSGEPAGEQTTVDRPTMRQLRSRSTLPRPPSSRDVINGRVELRRRFREELSHADTGAGATLAAEALLTAAVEETEHSLKWVMLEEARRLGEAAGQAAIVSRAIRVPPDIDREGLEWHRAGVERLLTQLSDDAERWACSGQSRAGEVRLRKEPSRVARRAARLPAPAGASLEEELRRCAVLTTAETHERPAA